VPPPEDAVAWAASAKRRALVLAVVVTGATGWHMVLASGSPAGSPLSPSYNGESVMHFQEYL